MALDIFNPVIVNVTLQAAENTPLPVNNVALVTNNVMVLPTADRIQVYTAAADVATDYGASSQEALFATVFFGQAINTATLILLSVAVPMTPTVNYIAPAIEDGYMKAVAQNLGGFAGIAYAEVTASPLWGTPSEAVAELQAIQAFAANNNTTFFTLLLTEDPDVMSNTTPNFLSAIQAVQFIKSLYVGILGYSTFSSDPGTPNKRSDAGAFAYLSGIELNQTSINGTYLYRQNFTGVVALPVGSTDSNSVVYTPGYVNTLVANQLNLYVTLGVQTIFADAFLAIDGKNITFSAAYISMLLAAEIKTQFYTLLTPDTLPYDQGGVNIGSGVLTTIMKGLAAAGAVDSLFTITAPFPDPTQPAPRILGPWQISGTVNGIAYGVDINANLSV